MINKASLKEFIEKNTERIGDEMELTLERLGEISKNNGNILRRDIEYVLQHDGELVGRFFRENPEE